MIIDEIMVVQKQDMQKHVRTPGNYLYRAVAARREDMTARTIIAKLVAFLFVQDSVRSSIKFI